MATESPQQWARSVALKIRLIQSLQSEDRPERRQEVIRNLVLRGLEEIGQAERKARAQELRNCFPGRGALTKSIRPEPPLLVPPPTPPPPPPPVIETIGATFDKFLRIITELDAGQQRVLLDRLRQANITSVPRSDNPVVSEPPRVSGGLSISRELLEMLLKPETQREPYPEACELDLTRAARLLENLINIWLLLNDRACEITRHFFEMRTANARQMKIGQILFQRVQRAERLRFEFAQLLISGPGFDPTPWVGSMQASLEVLRAFVDAPGEIRNSLPREIGRLIGEETVRQATGNELGFASRETRYWKKYIELWDGYGFGHSWNDSSFWAGNYSDVVVQGLANQLQPSKSVRL